MDLIELNKQAI